MGDSMKQGEQGTLAMFQVETAVAVVKSNTTVLDPGILYVGTTGDVEVKLAKSKEIVTFVNVPDGSFLPVLVIQVRAATTASDILICRME